MDAKALKEITSQLSILYVEDDINLREQTSKLFGHLFKEVKTAENGQIALDILKEQSFDLIITDINMPVMNGIELCKEIHKTDNEISIIITSAHDESNYLLELIDIGINKFILKPLDMHKMIKTLTSTCRNIINKKLVDKYKLEIEAAHFKVKENCSEIEVLLEALYEKISTLDISEEEVQNIDSTMKLLKSKIHS